ncbi:class I SAM-dependent methyltransferase [Jannaschia sp. R86511]|uniref:class I SAM-dependent methyltransferase n=1 Tax=Jannaschia sp. R86511 TaxID=3093853 RepID=UPI0036D40C71
MSCRACGQPATEPLVDLGPAPALVGALWDDADGARGSVRGQLDLHVCRRCGHVQNDAFDATLIDYDVDYDNSLHHSPTFQRFADDLAHRLVDERGIRDSHVVEVGSGKGDFLAAMARLGDNTGTGYDPTVDPDLRVDGVTLVPDYFRPELHLEPYDLLVCRHVLEHLDDPATMLRALRDEASGEDPLFYLEVPSAEFNFGPEGMWDSIYPHVSYFSAQSLEALVSRCGLRVEASGTAFGGQFLWVEARPGRLDDTVPDGVAEHLALLAAFGERWRSTTRHWRDRIGADDSDELVLWGAGAKGVTFLNAVDDGARLTVVDLNPNKWGRYLPGTGHRVQDPASLGERAVALVLITNPVYRDEISHHLEQIGVHADVVGL